MPWPPRRGGAFTRRATTPLTRKTQTISDSVQAVTDAFTAKSDQGANPGERHPDEFDRATDDDGDDGGTDPVERPCIHERPP